MKRGSIPVTTPSEDRTRSVAERTWRSSGVRELKQAHRDHGNTTVFRLSRGHAEEIG